MPSVRQRVAVEEGLDPVEHGVGEQRRAPPDQAFLQDVGDGEGEDQPLGRARISPRTALPVMVSPTASCMRVASGAASAISFSPSAGASSNGSPAAVGIRSASNRPRGAPSRRSM